MSSINCIVISSVRPEPTSAGQIVLHRHLVDRPGLQLSVYGHEPERISWRSLLRRIVGILGTRSEIFAGDFWGFWEGRWLDPELPEKPFAGGPNVVITVAHGDGYHAAIRFARKHRLPLVAFFQDWWPDCAPVHSYMREKLERQFRGLYHASTAAICVSKGMHVALGDHPNAIVLPPLPSAPSPSPTRVSSDPAKPFTVLYSGNLSEYGPMLAEALEASLDHPGIEIQVRGSNPAWPPEVRRKMKDMGRWLEFAPRDELDAWLASADAFLVPMVFDPRLRRRMESSFPSKLIEFAQFRKPLIVWGPEYSSAAGWGQNDKALVVSDPDPEALLMQIRDLSKSPHQQKYFAEKATTAAVTEFDPVVIHDKFLKVLNQVVASSST